MFFDPLSLAALETIAAAELASFVERLAKNDWSIEIGEGVPRWLAEHEHDPAYGARQVQRTLAREVLARLASSPTRRVRLKMSESELSVAAR